MQQQLGKKQQSLNRILHVAPHCMQSTDLLLRKARQKSSDWPDSPTFSRMRLSFSSGVCKASTDRIDPIQRPIPGELLVD